MGSIAQWLKQEPREQQQVLSDAKDAPTCAENCSLWAVSGLMYARKCMNFKGYDARTVRKPAGYAHA